jgi:hypothetical protein
MQQDKPNPVYDLQASLMDCRTNQDFVKKLENFIIHEMSWDRKINLNSIFSPETQKFYRAKLVQGLVYLEFEIKQEGLFKLILGRTDKDEQAFWKEYKKLKEIKE